MIVSGSQSVRAKRKKMLGATIKEKTPREGTTRAGIVRAGIVKEVTTRVVKIREVTPRQLMLKVTTMEPILTIKEMEETLAGRATEPILVETAMAAITRMEPLLTGTITEKTMEAGPMGRPTGTTIRIPMGAPGATR